MSELAYRIKNAPLGETHVFSLGQAGFIIKSKKGSLLAVDPYLSDCVARVEPDHVGFKRLLPKLLSPKDLELDVLICTHFHRDHFDVDAVPQLMDNSVTALFCPRDCKQDIEDAKIQNYTIVKPGDNAVRGDFKLHFINCDHGTGAPDAVGVIITVDDFNILVIGDSCLRLDRQEEYLQYGSIDVMIAPINGMYGNLDENDCYKLADALTPKLTIPCHYGMFANHGGNVLAFYKKFKQSNHNFLIMCQGEDCII